MASPYPGNFGGLSGPGLSGRLPGISPAQMRQLMRMPLPTPSHIGSAGELRGLLGRPFKPTPPSGYTSKGLLGVPSINISLSDVGIALMPGGNLKTIAKAVSSVISIVRAQAEVGHWNLPTDPGWGVSWCQPFVYTAAQIGVGGTLYCGPITETGVQTEGVEVQTQDTPDGLNHYYQFVAYDAVPATIGHFYAGWFKLLHNGDWYPSPPPAMPDWEVTSPAKWTYLALGTPRITNPVFEEGPVPAPSPSPEPPSNPHPPKLGTKERKFALSIGHTLVGTIFNNVTEALDVLNCMIGAMGSRSTSGEFVPDPDLPRPRYDPTRYGGQGGWRRPTPQDFAVYIYENVNRLDIQQFIECLIYNQVEDALIGTIGQLTREANQLRDFIAGIAFGPAL